MIVSPSGLSNGGRDFTAWFRALPLTYTSAFAGYADSGGPFRFVSTTLTVPLRRVPGEAAPAQSQARIWAAIWRSG